MDSLIQRLEEAEGPDRGLDGFIARDVEGWSPHFDLEGDELLEWPVMGGHWHPPGEKCDPANAHDCEDPPLYTASLDAAIGLCERAGPEFYWRVHKNTPTLMKAENGRKYWAACGAPGEQLAVTADTPALALCLALLKALKEKQG